MTDIQVKVDQVHVHNYNIMVQNLWWNISEKPIENQTSSHLVMVYWKCMFVDPFTKYNDWYSSETGTSPNP